MVKRLPFSGNKYRKPYASRWGGRLSADRLRRLRASLDGPQFQCLCYGGGRTEELGVVPVRQST